MLKKAKPTISLLAAATMAFTVLGNTSIKAAGKDDVPSNNRLIIGDMYFNFSGSNVIKGMLYAINNRGANPDDLKVIYVKRAGRTPFYYDFGESYDTTGDGLEIDAWESVKGEYDPISNSFTPYDSGATLPTSSSVGIKPRSGYEGIITINGDQVTIPANTTPKILKGAIQADDGIYGQTYELSDGGKKLDDDDVLVTGNTLKVTSEDGEKSKPYNLVVQSGGGGGQEDSADLEFKTNLDQGTLSYTAGAADVDPLTVEVQGKDGATTGTISYQWYKQTVGTSPLRATAVPVGEAIEGETSASFTPPVNAVGTTLYYVIATNTEEGKKASSIASKMVTVVVSEGELTDTEFTVSDYVYNDDSKDTKTMGKLTGTAPSGAKITIEANFTELKSVTAETDGTWKAEFPRQNANTIIKVTATLGGKSSTKNVTVKEASPDDLEAFRKSIDLNKLIEVRNNLHISKDDTGNDITEGYWVKNSEKLVAESFTSYVNLIEKVLDYKYQISDVDLKYIQSIAIPALETYKDKIFKVDGDKGTTSELTLLVGGNKQGTITIKDKDAGAIVGAVSNEVYTLNNGKKVTITATPNASNAVAGWLIDGKPSVETNKTTRELSITKATSVQAIFAPTEDASKVEDVIKKVEEITANGTKPFEVSISETAPSEDKIKATVEAAIKEILPEGAEVKGVVLEEIPTRATTKNYKATVTFKVGNNVEFTITIEISVTLGETVSDVELTLDVTGAENGKVVSVKQDGANVSSESNVYTVKSGKEVTFTVEPNAGYKAIWSENVKEVTTGNPNVVTITPTASNTITLDFVEDKENTSAITLNVGENGAVKVEVDGTSLTPTGNVYTVENGKTVTFTAIPKIGFEVDSWAEATVDPTNKNVATLKVTKNAEVGVTFKEKGTENVIKILSMQVDGGKFEDISQSVTTNVYSNTVDGAVYQIYASLSDPVAKFNANGEATFKFTLTAYSDSENFTGSAVTNFLEGLQIDTTRKVLMKELKPIESPTRELEITLSTEVIKSTDVDNPTEFTINFTYRGSADSNKVKPLVGKAIQIKATTEN